MGAVADFCAMLRRTVRGCGVSQAELARVLHRSDAAVSALLNGRRAKPPQFDEILAIVNHCRDKCGEQPPPGLVLDPAWWRTRLAELEGTAEVQRRPKPRYVQGALPVVPVEPIAFDFSSAVETLVGGREGFVDLEVQVLEPLGLAGAAPVELRGLFDGFATRVRSCRGMARTSLLCAADIVLLVAGFCDAVARLGAVRDAEAVVSPIDLATQVLEELGRVVLGSARARDSVELREEIAIAYAAAADVMHFGGFAGGSPDELAGLAQRRYGELLSKVTWECPELRLTSETFDPDQEEGRQQGTADRVGLIELGLLLREFANGDPVSPEQRERLRAPIAPAEGSGPTIPSLAAGYVNPSFRSAGPPAAWQLASDDWWESRPLREDIAGFLAAHLLSYKAVHAPLLVLGHPGSGKSLLARLIAARLPAAEFSCLHVELRHVPAELDLQQQLEEAAFRSTGRRSDWPDAHPAHDAVRVILVDGLDELIQAGAGRLDMGAQWRYLQSIEQFQQREFARGRPVIFIVTSRTVVADQVLTPPTTTVLRLEPFDDTRIGCWLEVWNATNRRYFASEDVEPLTWELIRPYQDLARHSLLLLMLALYDAVGNPLRRLDGRDIRRVDLYERLLVEFAHRQVVKREGPLPPSAEADAIENELRRLSVIAVGMFNRRSQSLTADEADSDLEVLLGEGGSTLLFGRFFFVHEAQAMVAEGHLRSYEFLHATFGEYLVARLVCNEARRVLDRWEQTEAAPIDDSVLYALLSTVPLTDRAEVLYNIGELLGPGGKRWNGSQTMLLRRLFRGGDRDGDQRADLPYRPAAGNRTEQEAAYGANLLLLILLAEDGVHASELLASSAPVERWWRRAQFWRSQFGEASWESFARTVSVERRSGGQSPENAGDLWISLGSAVPSVDDLAWTLRHRVRGPAAYLDARGVDASELIQRLALLCDADTQQLLHALAPLLNALPNTLRTYRVDEEQQAVSGAHAIVALVCCDRREPAHLAACYLDVLEIMRNLPDTDRPLVANVLVRHIVQDVDLLPAKLTQALLVELIRLASASGGTRWAGLWSAVEVYVVREMRRKDLADREQQVLVGHLHRYAGLFTEPQDRLMQILRAAGSSHVWAGVDHGSGREVLDEGLALLYRIPADKRSPEVVIGLLRLARELGEEEWFGEHAESLLQALDPNELGLLRATDVDALRLAVQDARLLSSLQSIEEIWRGPRMPNRVAYDR